MSVGAINASKQLLAGVAVHYQVAHAVQNARIVDVFQPAAETATDVGAEAPRRHPYERFPPTVGEYGPAILGTA